jgi:ABC-type uncharacterized transport system substrate-binding protein
MRLIGLAVVLAFSVNLAPLAGEAQQAGKVYRIGFRRSGQPPESYIEGLQQGLREQGYVPGQNVVVELRATDGSADQLPGLAEELMRSRVDVVLASAAPAALAGQANDHLGAGHFRGRCRSGRARARLEPGAPGRQHHRTGY